MRPPRGTHLERVDLEVRDGALQAVIALAGRGESDAPFVLEYEGVSNYSVDADEPSSALGDLLVDQLLPHSDGIRHELRFRSGTVSVTARDLTGHWQDSHQQLPADPVAFLRLLRTHRGMFLPDDSFASLAAYLHGYDARSRSPLWRSDFNRWLSGRLHAAGPESAWPMHVARAVLDPGQSISSLRDLTPAQDAAASELAFDVLEEFLGS